MIITRVGGQRFLIFGISVKINGVLDLVIVIFMLTHHGNMERENCDIYSGLALLLRGDFLRR